MRATGNETVHVVDNPSLRSDWRHQLVQLKIRKIIEDGRLTRLCLLPPIGEVSSR